MPPGRCRSQRQLEIQGADPQSIGKINIGRERGIDLAGPQREIIESHLIGVVAVPAYVSAHAETEISRNKAGIFRSVRP